MPIAACHQSLDGHWRAERIVRKIKKLNADGKQNILLVSGAYLEEQISVCVLEALAVGFDVHLLCDVITARNTRIGPTLNLRLLQAGAVPSCLEQVVYMWQSCETEIQESFNLQDILKRMRST